MKRVDITDDIWSSSSFQFNLQIQLFSKSLTVSMDLAVVVIVLNNGQKPSDKNSVKG
ncbi:hypothetical protein C5167_018452 [Papaver somniferum]|uniref:Uncharacterized protein n=1 Tax=Papaver somniferum TaxID=3469 RepID=A0A4Y7IQF0_PAPSO|nr:hypothetical protein C5167_018452 [Papaver somniferum]